MAKDSGNKKLDTVESFGKEDAPKIEAIVTKTAPTVLLVSFDRWFSTLGKPAHWKNGMRAYANTSGKKTLEAWAKIFANY